jgi:hypothetical protein
LCDALHLFQRCYPILISICHFWCVFNFHTAPLLPPRVRPLRRHPSRQCPSIQCPSSQSVQENIWLHWAIVRQRCSSITVVHYQLQDKNQINNIWFHSVGVWGIWVLAGEERPLVTNYDEVEQLMRSQAAFQNHETNDECGRS